QLLNLGLTPQNPVGSLPVRVRFPPPALIRFFYTFDISISGSGAGKISPRNFSRSGLIEGSNRAFDRCRADVHVALRRRQILVPGEFLDGPYGRATHRQVRAEGMTKDMWPVVLQARSSRRALRPAIVLSARPLLRGSPRGSGAA